MNPMKIPYIKPLNNIYLCACISLFTIPAASFAADLNLSWLPNSESQLDGYIIHYGPSPGHYTESVDVGNPSAINGEVHGVLSDLNEGVTYYLALTAYNTVGEQSPFSNEVEWTTPVPPQPSQGPAFVIDNGDSGTLQKGLWKPSSGQNSYGTKSDYSWEDTATYSYETPIYGRQELSLWWTFHNTRCTAVPVHVYDGTTLLDTVEVNQQKNGGQWNVLGTYNFSNGIGKVVIASTVSTCSTNADAVKFIGSLTTLTDASIEGPSSVLSNNVEDFDALAYYDDGSKNAIEPEWSIDCPGMAEISTTGSLTITDIYQDETCTITATYEENGLIVTSEKNISINYIAPAIEEIIIDNGDNATLAEGEWKPSSGPNSYGTQSVYTWVQNARYTFEATVNGSQELSLWWTFHDTRCNNVPVDIYDDMKLIDTVWINQKQNGGKWNVLGKYDFPSGIGAVVIEATTSSCSTNVDAVRFSTAN